MERRNRGNFHTASPPFSKQSTPPLLEACHFSLPDAEKQFQQPQLKKTNGTLAGTVVSEQRFKVTYKFHEATGQKYQIKRLGRLRHLFSSKINFLGGLQFTNQTCKPAVFSVHSTSLGL